MLFSSPPVALLLAQHGLTAAINAIIFTKKKIICQQLILILG